MTSLSFESKLIEIMESKPIDSICKISIAINNNSKYFFLEKQQVFIIHTARKCLLLEEGMAHVIDSTGTELYEITPPFVIGIYGCFGFHNKIKLRFNAKSQIRTVDTTIMMSVLYSQSLWADVASILAYNYIYEQFIFNELQHPAIPTIVKICKAISMADFYKKKNGSDFLLTKFIINKTSLSRSAVMKTLFTLKKLEVIFINKGVLQVVDTQKLNYYIE
ncbi:TPA: helix-turn-helix domain-containing protein [Raoultella planticola]|nr:helix-turn-helix domain-containing protein [Raoultella planticola]